MTYQPSHPNLRRSTTCPFCDAYKNTGLIACWPCFGEQGLKFGNPQAEAILDAAEHNLTCGSAA